MQYREDQTGKQLSILGLGCRDQVNIATKLPHSLVKKSGDLEKYFAEQHCPQGSPIREERDRAVKAQETPVFKVANLAADLLGKG